MVYADFERILVLENNKPFKLYLDEDAVYNFTNSMIE